MHRLIFVIAIIIIFNEAVDAQSVQFGFTGGAGTCNVAKTNNVGVAFEQRNSMADFYAGLTAEIKINNDFAFRPEFYFERKGWTSKYNNLMINLAGENPFFTINDSILNSDKVKLNYIKLPLN